MAANKETKVEAPTSSETVIREQGVEVISDGNVFYNPVQEFNRDLSVAVLNVYFKTLFNKGKDEVHKNSSEENAYVAGQKYDNGMRILEALSATGLRSIRYAKEVAGVCSIIANDFDKGAVDSIRVNVKRNGVENIVQANYSDAATLMYLSTAPKDHFDVIDLDPYGCPNRFLDGAIQSIANGGLLLVTATDMSILASYAPEVCYTKYGSVSLRMKCCHEMALRILLFTIDMHANRYGKHIEPLLSTSVDFYIRVFVRVHHSRVNCKFSITKQSMIYQCTVCDTFTLHPLGCVKGSPTDNAKKVKIVLPTGPPVGIHCEHCGGKHRIGGPIWSEPIHNFKFVQNVLEDVKKEPLCNLNTQKRLIGVLSMISEELPDSPLYYTVDRMCCVLKLEAVPNLKFRSAILHAGYRVSFSHACKNSIKTNAPPAVLWDILRCWSVHHPVKAERRLKFPAINAILDKAPKITCNFEQLHPEANPMSRRHALSRFQANPTAYWGPGTRATTMTGQNKQLKSVRNQNKRRKQKTSLVADDNNDEGECKKSKLNEN